MSACEVWERRICWERRACPGRAMWAASEQAMCVSMPRIPALKTPAGQARGPAAAGFIPTLNTTAAALGPDVMLTLLLTCGPVVTLRCSGGCLMARPLCGGCGVHEAA